jgi:hypothetical protein
MGIRVISNMYKIGVVAPSVELRSGEHKDATMYGQARITI